MTGERRRARDLGFVSGGQPGPLNGITDVPGVEVGCVTLVEGDGPLTVGRGPVRTGVTAILPRGREGVATPCAAGVFSLNGNGELTGSHWLAETGSLTSPVCITNTHAVGAVHSGIVDWVVEHHPRLADEWLLPVVAETYDGWLNDINGRHVRPEHAVQAIDAAGPGPAPEGSVGGGTGMNCYAFKGGNGTASRRLTFAGEEYTVGVFLQANFGARRELVVRGTPVGPHLAADNPLEDGDRTLPPGAGSVIVVVATDAPLLPGQCTALARRVGLGLARTGTSGSHFSGDIFLCFSTANEGALSSTSPRSDEAAAALETMSLVPWGRLDPFFEAVVQGVEEATLNALVANTADVVGRDGHRSPCLPVDAVVDLLRSGGPAPTS
ncbi:MAG: D-aminopeptidase [uncultured Nocardioidaceae bacterium]|uniref:D-aminopeptidase n=1 Tax=uncultured Nocardioidaceae bacterium TaxID=253824 RepID=A0A6J4LAT3_9ACTN|nr:MAG: D-aminopeptidase [uncultured Nocardioidaceae bacterium]